MKIRHYDNSILFNSDTMFFFLRFLCAEKFRIFPPLFILLVKETQKPKIIKTISVFINIAFFKPITMGNNGPGEITFKYYHKIKKNLLQMP